MNSDRFITVNNKWDTKLLVKAYINNIVSFHCVFLNEFHLYKDIIHLSYFKEKM